MTRARSDERGPHLHLPRPGQPAVFLDLVVTGRLSTPKWLISQERELDKVKEILSCEMIEYINNNNIVVNKNTIIQVNLVI